MQLEFLISLAQLLLIKDYETFDVEDLEIGLIDQNIISKDINEILAMLRRTVLK